ncbi:ATP-binding cassette domain-containing protein [Nonomuraea sp. NPDC050790]|uniref:ATP-binding cassette domain-containing protein n=1 Tax=Nonomuraea sp. NPDC050790 TaxID=3364371 RepID=UPI0037B1D3F0
MDLSNVSFRYRRRAPDVIRHADATLSPGDVIELTGANGAGKSTLLRLLAGLTRPTRGKLSGRPRTVGYAPDHLPTAQPFTVAAYLDHMARIRRAATWRPWADRLNLTPLVRLPLRELSKGSAHKVALVQALMCDPGLLLLDEPFAGLDTATREALPGIVAELAGRGTIVVAGDHEAGLHDLPSLRHWTLTDGFLREPSPAARNLSPSPTPPPAIHLTPPSQPTSPAANPPPAHLAGSQNAVSPAQVAAPGGASSLGDTGLTRDARRAPETALAGEPNSLGDTGLARGARLAPNAALAGETGLAGDTALAGQPEAGSARDVSWASDVRVAGDVSLASDVTVAGDVSLAGGVGLAGVGRVGGVEDGVVVEVRVPGGEVGAFLARMRAEGYQATEAAQ